MDIRPSLDRVSVGKPELRRPLSRSQPVPDQPSNSDRIENESGVVLTGPSFFRGDEEIRDIAAFSAESLEALALAQEE